MLTRNASTNSTPNDWATHEFTHAPLSDQRLVQRLISLATDFALQPTASIPQACGSWARAKAAYRFFDNDAITPEDLLASHLQATIQPFPAVKLAFAWVNSNNYPVVLGIADFLFHFDVFISRRHSYFEIQPATP